MGQETISVIIPAYNIAPWLGRCLNSLLHQVSVNLEIIVVDDGSRDRTADVLDEYAAIFPNIKAIHKENGGVTSARLRGVAEATGEWVGFIDGDDTIEPDMYSRLLANAIKHNADISHCGHRVCFPDGRVEYVHNTGEFWIQDRLTALKDLLDGGMIESGLCTKLYRRALFDGLEDWMDRSIKNNEDLLMNYYLFERAKMSVYEDFCPYHYILRSGSASYRAFNEHSLFDPIRVRQIILKHCDAEMQEAARIALLRNLLFIYGQLALNPDKQYDDYRAKVRKLLTEQRGYFPLLSRRNQILANMVCKAPWMFHIAYGAYVKLFRKKEEH